MYQTCTNYNRTKALKKYYKYIRMENKYAKFTDLL